MKKTLITLMALMGVASAATVQTIDTTDSNLLSYLDFSSSPSTSQYGDVATVKEGYGIINASHAMWTRGSLDSQANTNAFTLSFDVRNFADGDLLCVASNGTSNAIASNWDKVTLNTGTGAEDTLELKYYGPSVTTTISTGIKNDVTRTEWTTITLVGETTGGTQYVSLYVDGNYIDKLNMTTLSPGGWCGRGIDGFQFGNGFRGEGTCDAIDGDAEIDNVLFYKRALTASEVKGLINIPEPATATLSLLALAGLAARRRRK